MQTEKVWESQGQYFTKIPILVGDYINKKGIGVANRVIPKTEYRWMDTDYTVHPTKNHPPIPPIHGDTDPISWILAHNRKYSIGKVVDIDRITNPDSGIHTLKGTIRFQEPQLAKQAYQMGIIPLYNSSSIYETARDESTGLTTDYIPIDNCAVDTPAGDLELFKTGTFCEGGTECIHDLKQSGINSECGYCKLEALKSFKFHYPFADHLHDSHNSMSMKQSSSMSSQATAGSEPAGTQADPTLDTVKEVKGGKGEKGAKGKGAAEIEKSGKEINDSGWVSSNEDREEKEGEEGEGKQEGEQAKSSEPNYKELYEQEKAKNDNTTKTVQELLAESRLNKVSAKFNALPIEIWEGDDKARAKDIKFFNGLYDKKIDETMLMEIIDKHVSKIPIKAIQEAGQKSNLKQSGLDAIITSEYIARTKSTEDESELTEGDIVLGALED